MFIALKIASGFWKDWASRSMLVYSITVSTSPIFDLQLRGYMSCCISAGPVIRLSSSHGLSTEIQRFRLLPSSSVQ